MKPESLAAYAYNAIKQKIVDGRFTPGDMLKDSEIAVELGVSRTPVREALRRLSHEGWVVWKEHQGIIVSKATHEDEYQLHLLREMIEPFIVKKIITSKRPRALAGILSNILDEMEEVQHDPVEFMKKDMEFHTIIVDYLGLTKLKPLWNIVCDDMTRLVVQSVRRRRPPADILQEHKVLVEAFWHSDLEAALECITTHCKRIIEDYPSP